MASWTEIERVRKKPGQFRALAERLLTTPELSPWESTFLESVLTRYDKAAGYSLRQSEKLFEIRDDNELLEKVRGFSVMALIRDCNLARLDLSEDDETWIAALVAKGTSSIRRGQAGRLLRLAALLGIVENDEATA